MNPQAKTQRIEESRRICRESRVPFTLQRRVVLEAVLDLDSHPTADQVHELVIKRHAGISRATVYRTLETLVRMGVITKVCHTGRAVRFDSRSGTHHHLVCVRCDEVVDFFDERLNALPAPDVSEFGFDVSDIRVQVRGICRRCRETEESHEESRRHASAGRGGAERRRR